MSVDEVLRTALRDAASGPALDEEHALRAVRARVPAAIPGVDPVDVEERARPAARLPRVVAVLAACALLAGAIALPLALRSTRGNAPTPAAATGRCRHAVTRGYRSTAVVRLAEEAPGTSGPRLRADPVQTALALCDAVLARAHPRSAEIQFAAESKTTGDLSLIVTTPRTDDTAALARAWALAFVAAVRTDVRRQIIEQQQQLTANVRALHEQLRHVDTQLAKMAPSIYGDVARIDARLPGDNSPAGPPGFPPKQVPPVPETGSVKLLNLAFERISILQELQRSATQSSTLRIARVKPQVYASVVSVSSPVRLPTPGRGSGHSALFVAIGLLVGGGLLAAGGLVLGRRRRGPQSP